MINIFNTFMDFSQHLGLVKALLLVVSFYGLTWVYKKLPEQLAKNDCRLSKVLLTNLNP